MNRRVSALRSEFGRESSILNDDSDIDWASSTRRDTEWWKRLKDESENKSFTRNAHHSRIDDNNTMVVEESYISFKLQEEYDLSEDDNMSMESLSDISRMSGMFAKPKTLFKSNTKKAPQAPLAPPPPREEEDHSFNKSLSFQDISMENRRPKSLFKSNTSTKKVNIEDYLDVSNENLLNSSNYLEEPEQPGTSKPKRSIFKSNTERKSKLFADALSFTSDKSERFPQELDISTTTSSRKILGEDLHRGEIELNRTNRTVGNESFAHSEYGTIGNFTIASIEHLPGDEPREKKSLFKSNQRKSKLYEGALSMSELQLTQSITEDMELDGQGIVVEQGVEEEEGGSEGEEEDEEIVIETEAMSTRRRSAVVEEKEVQVVTGKRKSLEPEDETSIEPEVAKVPRRESDRVKSKRASLGAVRDKTIESVVVEDRGVDEPAVEEDDIVKPEEVQIPDIRVNESVSRVADESSLHDTTTEVRNKRGLFNEPKAKKSELYEGAVSQTSIMESDESAMQGNTANLRRSSRRSLNRSQVGKTSKLAAVEEDNIVTQEGVNNTQWDQQSTSFALPNITLANKSSLNTSNKPKKPLFTSSNQKRKSTLYAGALSFSESEESREISQDISKHLAASLTEQGDVEENEQDKNDEPVGTGSPNRYTPIVQGRTLIHTPPQVLMKARMTTHQKSEQDTQITTPTDQNVTTEHFEPSGTLVSELIDKDIEPLAIVAENINKSLKVVNDDQNKSIKITSEYEMLNNSHKILNGSLNRSLKITSDNDNLSKSLNENEKLNRSIKIRNENDKSKRSIFKSNTERKSKLYADALSFTSDKSERFAQELDISATTSGQKILEEDLHRGEIELNRTNRTVGNESFARSEYGTIGNFTMASIEHLPGDVPREKKSLFKSNQRKSKLYEGALSISELQLTQSITEDMELVGQGSVVEQGVEEEEGGSEGEEEDEEIVIETEALSTRRRSAVVEEKEVQVVTGKRKSLKPEDETSKEPEVAKVPRRESDRVKSKRASLGAVRDKTIESVVVEDRGVDEPAVEEDDIVKPEEVQIPDIRVSESVSRVADESSLHDTTTEVRNKRGLFKEPKAKKSELYEGAVSQTSIMESDESAMQGNTANLRRSSRRSLNRSQVGETSKLAAVEEDNIVTQEGVNNTQWDQQSTSFALPNITLANKSSLNTSNKPKKPLFTSSNQKRKSTLYAGALSFSESEESREISQDISKHLAASLTEQGDVEENEQDKNDEPVGTGSPNRYTPIVQGRTLIHTTPQVLMKARMTTHQESEQDTHITTPTEQNVVTTEHFEPSGTLVSELIDKDIEPLAIVAENINKSLKVVNDDQNKSIKITSEHEMLNNSHKILNGSLNRSLKITSDNDNLSKSLNKNEKLNRSIKIRNENENFNKSLKLTNDDEIVNNSLKTTDGSKILNRSHKITNESQKLIDKYINVTVEEPQELNESSNMVRESQEVEESKRLENMVDVNNTLTGEESIGVNKSLLKSSKRKSNISQSLAEDVEMDRGIQTAVEDVIQILESVAKEDAVEEPMVIEANRIEVEVVKDTRVELDLENEVRTQAQVVGVNRMESEVVQVEMDVNKDITIESEVVGNARVESVYVKDDLVVLNDEMAVMEANDGETEEVVESQAIDENAGMSNLPDKEVSVKKINDSSLQDTTKELILRRSTQHSLTIVKEKSVDVDNSLPGEGVSESRNATAEGDTKSYLSDKSHNYSLFNRSKKGSIQNVSEKHLLSDLQGNAGPEESGRKSQSYTMFHVSKQNLMQSRESTRIDEETTNRTLTDASNAASERDVEEDEKSEEESDEESEEESEEEEEDREETVEEEDREETVEEEREESIEEDEESISQQDNDYTAVEQPSEPMEDSGDNIVLNMSDVEMEEASVVRVRRRMEIYSTFRETPPKPQLQGSKARERKEKRMAQFMQHVARDAERIRKEVEDEVSKLLGTSIRLPRPLLLRHPQEMLDAIRADNKTTGQIVEIKGGVEEKRGPSRVGGKVGPNKLRGAGRIRASGQGQVTKNTKKAKLYMKELWITRKLYQFVQNKLKPKFGVMYMKQSETFIKFLANTVTVVEKGGPYCQCRVDELRTHMASLGLLHTNREFIEFVRTYLPHGFRIRSIPAPGRDVPRMRGKLDDPIVRKK